MGFYFLGAQFETIENNIFIFLPQTRCLNLVTSPYSDSLYLRQCGAELSKIQLSVWINGQNDRIVRANSIYM